MASDDQPLRAAPSRGTGPGTGAAAGSGLRRGRPPRIGRADIARAASEIPLSDLSLRSVAERLSVSVPGLYHYVRGRDDLLALAAEQSMRQRAFPADHGQHWAVWLLEWAEYIHGAFAGDPGLLKQYIDGAIGMEVMAESIDAALAPCIRQGFTPAAALHAYELVAGYAIGAAVAQIRDGRTRAEGRPFERELRRVMARGDLPLPHLGGLAAEPGFGRPAPFQAQIATVLIGIAVQRDESAEQVATLLAGRDGTG